MFKSSFLALLAVALLALVVAGGLLRWHALATSPPTPPSAASPKSASLGPPSATLSWALAHLDSAFLTQRHRAIALLGQLAAHDPRALAALAAMADDQSALQHDRRQLYQALATAAAEGSAAALTKLQHLAQRHHLPSRLDAVAALAQSAVSAPQLTPGLVDLLLSYEIAERELAVESLNAYLQPHPTLHQALLATLEPPASPAQAPALGSQGSTIP